MAASWKSSKASTNSRSTNTTHWSRYLASISSRRRSYASMFSSSVANSPISTIGITPSNTASPPRMPACFRCRCTRCDTQDAHTLLLHRVTCKSVQAQPCSLHPGRSVCYLASTQTERPEDLPWKAGSQTRYSNPCLEEQASNAGQVATRRSPRPLGSEAWPSRCMRRIEGSAMPTPHRKLASLGHTAKRSLEGCGADIARIDHADRPQTGKSLAPALVRSLP